MEKILAQEKKTHEQASMEKKTVSEARKKKEEEQEAQRKLDVEILHQQEESQRRALGRAMLSDAASNRPTFNKSTVKLLNNFQGNHILNKNIYLHIELKKIYLKDSALLVGLRLLLFFNTHFNLSNELRI